MLSISISTVAYYNVTVVVVVVVENAVIIGLDPVLEPSFLFQFHYLHTCVAITVIEIQELYRRRMY
jgi:hypothetical protein